MLMGVESWKLLNRSVTVPPAGCARREFQDHARGDRIEGLIIESLSRGVAMLQRPPTVLSAADPAE